MLAAYRGQVPDGVPVSPELWDATAIAVSDRPWHELVGPFAKIPWWRTHLAAFEFFECDAWIVPAVGLSPSQRERRRDSSRWLDAETIETEITWRTSRGELRAAARSTPVYADWLVEHPVKRFPQDMIAYEEVVFTDPEHMDLTEVADAIEGVGEEGLVTPFVGEPFTSFLATARDGGMTQTIFDLLEHESYCRELHGRFLEHLTQTARAVLERTPAQALFISGGYSGLPIISPALFRRWDVPALAAVAGVCREHGAVLHLHQHGHLLPILDDLIAAGVGLVCPLLPPPQGDVADLSDLKRRCAGRLALKGNLDPMGALRYGTPAEVEAEVRRCLQAAAPGGGFILGTADSTVADTPVENLRAFVAAGRRFGQY